MTNLVMAAIEEALANNRRTLPPTPAPTWEGKAQALAVLCVEAEERLSDVLKVDDDPLCARLRHAVHETRHMRHLAEQARANSLGPSDGALEKIVAMRRRCVEAGQQGCDVQSAESAEAVDAVCVMVADMERHIAQVEADRDQLAAALQLAEGKLVEKSRMPVAVERVS